MNDVIIYGGKQLIIIDTPHGRKTYIFRSLSKNNNKPIPTYVFHVNDVGKQNIKITLPQCSTNLTQIP